MELIKEIHGAHWNIICYREKITKKKKTDVLEEKEETDGENENGI